MKKSALAITLIVIPVLFCNIANAQILSPVASVEGQFDTETKAFFIGKTTLSGTFHGYPLDPFIDLPLLDEIKAFPLIGSTVLGEIDSILIADMQKIENLTQRDIINNDLGYQRFSNVKIITNNAPYLLGFNNGSVTVESTMDYAISSVLSYELNQQTLPLLVTMTNSNRDLTYAGEPCYFMEFPTGNVADIRIEDSNGTTLWKDDINNKLILIDDTEFTITQTTPISLLPLSFCDEQNHVKLMIYPADDFQSDISGLMKAVTNSISEMEDFNMGDLSETIQGFDMILEAVSSTINGAMVLMGTNLQLTIDNSDQLSSTVIFARGDAIDLSLFGDDDSYEFTVSGRYRLVFLDDHLYTTQAKESDTGVAFPLSLFAVWILAIGVFILFRFYIKTEVNPTRDEFVKRYALYFHIAVLILAFILMDREISFQFGISAIDALFSQGFSLTLGVFLAVEIVLWIIGYFALSLPIRIITESLFKLIGIGKGGRGIAKGIGGLFIWVFAAFYAKLIVNIILSFIGPGSLIPVS